MQNKRRRNKASKFIPYLHIILSDKESGAYWKEDGKTFVLNDISKLISNSLPKYFRHSNISSFIRQLNLYGFKKLVGEEIEENTYYHEKFEKNYITQLKPIRSFYNQQKYGRLRNGRNADISQACMSSMQSNEKQDCLIKSTGFSDPHSQICLKQKIAILERQNQRLKVIEQQHADLLKLLNFTPKAPAMYDYYNDHGTNHIFNILSTSKVPSGQQVQPAQNYAYRMVNQVQNGEQNFSYYQNAYYMPFQNIL